MKRSRVTGVLIALLAVSTAATLAWGKQKSENEALALANAKVLLSQAVDNALSVVPGQALSAELDDEESPAVFVVEVFSQGQTYEVTLDTQNGVMLKKQLDREDRDDQDRDDDQDREDKDQE